VATHGKQFEQWMPTTPALPETWPVLREGLRFAVFKNGKNIGERELDLGSARELRFVPVIAASKRGGLLQTVIGAVLIVASFFAGPAGPGLFNAGLALMAGGRDSNAQPPGSRAIAKRRT
jgi:predicted phage tail protein